jgi:alpha-1,6-mannosyltransferase
MHLGMRQWAEETSPYGPLWNLIAAPATLIGGDEIGPALVAFKVLAVACVLGGGTALVLALRAIRPAGAATGALVYLWNPLVLWEGVGNAHNDVLLALLLLLALLAWARRWNGLIVPLLVAAALVKYVGALLLPLAVIALWRRARSWPERWQAAFQSAALSLLVGLVGFAPFYDVGAVGDSLKRQSEYIGTSPAGLAISLLGDRVAEPGLTDGVRAVGVGILLLAIAVATVRLWHNPECLPRACFEVTFVGLLVATWWFRSWYLIWPMALVGLLPVGWPFWRMLSWTFAGLLVYGHYIWIWEFWGVEYGTIRDTGILFTFAPVVVVTLISVGHRPPAVRTVSRRLGRGDRRRAGSR